MKRKPNILFFCMIFVANAAYCQNYPKLIFGNADQKKNSLHNSYSQNNLLAPGYVLPDFATTHKFAFFCKQELKLERATKIPFKFRLGNIQYCDWLEGKDMHR